MATQLEQDLLQALYAVQGRIMNVKIDLATGRTKAQAMYALEECVRNIDAAIAKAKGE